MTDEMNQGAVCGQTTPLTFGQKMTGVDFNPSGNANVAKVKQLAADMIDTLNAAMASSDISNDKATIAGNAVADTIRASMMIVKAITFKY